MRVSGDEYQDQIKRLRDDIFVSFGKTEKIHSG